MSGIQLLSLLFVLLLTLGEALEVFVKLNGEFVAIPGDYMLVKKELKSPRRSKRTASMADMQRPVYINGETKMVTLSTVFKMYSELGTSEARRPVFAPSHEGFGDCTVYETISWPARCLPVPNVNPNVVSLCTSRSRGITEVKAGGCLNNDRTDLTDFFGR